MPEDLICKKKKDGVETVLFVIKRHIMASVKDIINQLQGGLRNFHLYKFSRCIQEISFVTSKVASNRQIQETVFTFNLPELLLLVTMTKL